MAIIMNDDMTYQEVRLLKSNIQEFIREIRKIAYKHNFDIQQNDINFFTFIAKHIIFFKYIISSHQQPYYYKVLISDFYFLILSIIKNEIRYVYVNERSIIENYLRDIMQTSVQDNHITDKVFEEFRDKTFKCPFSKIEYSKIKNEYIDSCGYIHGSTILNDNLAFVLGECENKTFDSIKRNKYYARVQTIIGIFDKLLVSEKALYISGCFHRKKTILEYLIGRDKVNILFKILH
jgi:hypothetical protein